MNRQVIGVALVLITTGCAVRFSQRSPWDIQQIQALSDQLEHFKSLAQLNAEEARRLREGKALLDQRLSSEIASDEVSVGFDERGLVVRVLDRVLFDSGKAEMRQDAQHVIGKVARTLTQELVDQPISIEGHTDNVPITRSSWKDNWELSLARARAVLTTLVKDGVQPNRVIAAGYGEYRPLASNDTDAGRQQNRRVEIVVLPSRSTQAHGEAAGATSVSSTQATWTK